MLIIKTHTHCQNDDENSDVSSSSESKKDDGEALQNELECKVAVFVDTCSFLLLLLKGICL